MCRVAAHTVEAYFATLILVDFRWNKEASCDACGRGQLVRCDAYTMTEKALNHGNEITLIEAYIRVLLNKLMKLIICLN